MESLCSIMSFCNSHRNLVLVLDNKCIFHLEWHWCFFDQACEWYLECRMRKVSEVSLGIKTQAHDCHETCYSICNYTNMRRFVSRSFHTLRMFEMRLMRLIFGYFLTYDRNAPQASYIWKLFSENPRNDPVSGPNFNNVIDIFMYFRSKFHITQIGDFWQNPATVINISSA